MNNFMQIALLEASVGFKNNEGGPFGAVIIRNNQIIARAHNEVLKSNDPTAHAEITAIRKACASLKTYSLENCEIYTTCEPCPMCLGAIMWARISRIYFGADRKAAAAVGFDDDYLYQIINGNTKTDKLEMTKIDEEECLKLMREWSQKEDKVIY